MGLYDNIAAGHQGQCFALLSRRFMISEPEAAAAVQGLLPAVLGSFAAWVATPRGLSAFLAAMSKGGHERALSSPSFFTNHAERDRGLQLVTSFQSVQELDAALIARAAESSGLPYRVMLQMLPFVALFAYGAMRRQFEEPAREILATRSLFSVRRSADPFMDLADLIEWDSKGHRHGPLAGILGGLFGRRTAPPGVQPLQVAAE